MNGILYDENMMKMTVDEKNGNILMYHNFLNTSYALVALTKACDEFKSMHHQDPFISIKLMKKIEGKFTPYLTDGVENIIIKQEVKHISHSEALKHQKGNNNNKKIDINKFKIETVGDRLTRSVKVNTAESISKTELKDIELKINFVQPKIQISTDIDDVAYTCQFKSKKDMEDKIKVINHVMRTHDKVNNINQSLLLESINRFEVLATLNDSGVQTEEDIDLKLNEMKSVVESSDKKYNDLKVKFMKFIKENDKYDDLMTQINDPEIKVVNLEKFRESDVDSMYSGVSIDSKIIEAMREKSDRILKQMNDLRNIINNDNIALKQRRIEFMTRTMWRKSKLAIKKYEDENKFDDDEDHESEYDYDSDDDYYNDLSD